MKIGGNPCLASSNFLAENSRVLLPPVQLKERFAEFRDKRDKFEYMLIDTLGGSTCGDAQLLGLVEDAAVLVFETNNARRLTARTAKESLN